MKYVTTPDCAPPAGPAWPCPGRPSGTPGARDTVLVTLFTGHGLKIGDKPHKLVSR